MDTMSKPLSIVYFIVHQKSSNAIKYLLFTMSVVSKHCNMNCNDSPSHKPANVDKVSTVSQDILYAWPYLTIYLRLPSYVCLLCSHHP